MGGRGSGSRLPRPRGKLPTPAPEPEPEPEKSAKDQENFDDLLKYMQDNYQMTFAKGVSELDFGAVRGNMQGLEEVIKEFPQAIGLLEHRISFEVSRSSKTYADASFNSVLRFGRVPFKNTTFLDRSYNRDVKSGFHPAGTTSADILRHEMGHLLARALSAKAAQSIQDLDRRYHAQIDDWNHNTQEDKIITQALKTMGAKAGHALSFKEQATKVSRYAAKNKGEAFAECIADYSKNGENAQELSKEVWRLVKKELG